MPVEGGLEAPPPVPAGVLVPVPGLDGAVAGGAAGVLEVGAVPVGTGVVPDPGTVSGGAGSG